MARSFFGYNWNYWGDDFTWLRQNNEFNNSISYERHWSPLEVYRDRASRSRSRSVSALVSISDDDTWYFHSALKVKVNVAHFNILTSKKSSQSAISNRYPRPRQTEAEIGGDRNQDYPRLRQTKIGIDQDRDRPRPRPRPTETETDRDRDWSSPTEPESLGLVSGSVHP